METHTRRRVLASAGIVLPGVTAGCLDTASDPGSGTTGDEPDDSDETDDADEGDETDDGEETDDTSRPIEEDPRVDEPPYEIERPEEPDDPDEDWNEHYLGEGMADEPTLEFDVHSSVGLADSALERSDDGSADGEYCVSLLESQSELDEAVDLAMADDEDRDALETIDFAETVVVIVESGWGSSSVIHQWVRVEDAEDGLHLHGYDTDPLVQTMDVTSRHSVLTVERPTDLEFARASLTVSEDRRVHFNSTEGTVSVDESD